MAVHERFGNLNVWWFPKEFSQSRFGEFQHAGTNSCTLISLILADKVSKEGRGFHRQNSIELPRRAVDVFAVAINEGNSVYDRVANAAAKAKAAAKSTAPTAATTSPIASHNQNLNIPDALSALRDHPNFELTEWFYTHLQADPQRESARTIALRLVQVMNVGVELYRKPSPESSSYLFAALISDNRTVLFTMQFPESVITFFDSHQHGREAGAVIAQCTYRDIFEMMYWFVTMNHDIYSSQPTMYEVSFLTNRANALPVPDKLDKVLKPAKTVPKEEAKAEKVEKVKK